MKTAQELRQMKKEFDEREKIRQQEQRLKDEKELEEKISAQIAEIPKYINDVICPQIEKSFKDSNKTSVYLSYTEPKVHKEIIKILTEHGYVAHINSIFHESYYNRDYNQNEPSYWSYTLEISW